MAKRRTQGNGTISKRPTGSWQARFTTSEGKRLTRTFPTKREAEEWLTDIKADTQRGEFIEPSEVTLIEWILDFLKTYKQATAPATKRHHIDCLKRLQKHAPTLLTTPLQQLTPTGLQQAVNDLQAVYSSRSVRMSIGLVRAALKKAVTLNILRRNPADDLTLPAQVTTNGGKLISPAAMAKIIDWCKTPDKSPSVQAYKDLIFFLARHGCRPGEARAIRIDRIKADWLTIDSALDQQQNLKDTKTHQARRIPIALDCLQMVEQRMKLSKQGWLFESSTGTPLQHRKLAQCIKDLTNGEHSPYDLRHTFCSNAVSNGGNLKAISAITGHSIEVLLSTYVHVNDDDLSKIIQSAPYENKEQLKANH